MDRNSFLRLLHLISLATIYRWFKEDSFRLLFKNAGTLLSGNLIAQILGLITFAITARILGPTLFGILILITTYVTIVDRLVNFQSWQALIKYGSEALENTNKDEFKRVVKFCSLLDLVTALAGTIVAIVTVVLVGQWFSWESETIKMAAVYSLVILFNMVGTPTGVLRLFNRFTLFATQHIITAVIKLIGIIIIFFIGADLWLVLLLWMGTAIIGHLLLLYLGWRVLYQNGFHGIMTTSMKNISDHHPGIWGFVLTTNLNSSVGLARREVDVLLVGGLTGVEGAGIFKIAKQIASIPGMITDPLYQTIYPDLSRFWARNDIISFKKHMLRSGAIAGVGATVMWFGFIIFGLLFIQLVFGTAYLGAQPILVWYMLAIVIAIAGFPLQPAMLSMGHPKLSLYIQIISTVIYLAILVFALLLIGIVGAAIAYVIYNIVWTTLMIRTEMKVITQEEKAQVSK